MESKLWNPIGTMATDLHTYLLEKEPHYSITLAIKDLCKNHQNDCFEKIIADSLMPHPDQRPAAAELHARLEALGKILPTQTIQSTTRALSPMTSDTSSATF